MRIKSDLAETVSGHSNSCIDCGEGIWRGETCYGAGPDDEGPICRRCYEEAPD